MTPGASNEKQLPTFISQLNQVANGPIGCGYLLILVGIAIVIIFFPPLASPSLRGIRQLEEAAGDGNQIVNPR